MEEFQFKAVTDSVSGEKNDSKETERWSLALFLVIDYAHVVVCDRFRQNDFERFCLSRATQGEDLW